MAKQEKSPPGRARKLFGLPNRGGSAVTDCAGQISHAERGQAAVLPCCDDMRSPVWGTVGSHTSGWKDQHTWVSYPPCIVQSRREPERNRLVRKGVLMEEGGKGARVWDVHRLPLPTSIPTCRLYYSCAVGLRNLPFVILLG